MTECARCGHCCLHMGFGPTWERLHEMAAVGNCPDAEFIVEHVRYCWGTGYYWCTLFDFATKLCTIQDTKPAMCAEFPYFRPADPRYCDHPASMADKLNAGCAFYPEALAALEHLTDAIGAPA